MTPLFADLADPFFPKPTSPTAGSVDELFYFILVVSIVFFAIIVGAMVLLQQGGADEVGFVTDPLDTYPVPEEPDAE